MSIQPPYFAYFGTPWPSGVCDEGTQVDTPVGVACVLCTVPIAPDDQGSFMGTLQGRAPVHRECSLRSVMGGIGHLTDHAHWCLVEHDPDGGRTYRESALATWDYFQQHGQEMV